jgi:uncharacterized protein (DUF779 family)
VISKTGGMFHQSKTCGDGSTPWYLVNIKIAGKWMFIPLKMVLIGIDPYPYIGIYIDKYDKQISHIMALSEDISPIYGHGESEVFSILKLSGT